MAITVKVIRVPGAVFEVGLSDGATVNDALSVAGVTLGSTETITVNGSAASLSYVLSDGDRIILSKEAKSA